MTHVTDDLDQLIEDVARSMVAGEPRRVDAASVRKAISPAFDFSKTLAWLGLAAVLIIALGMGVSRRDGGADSPALSVIHESSAPKAATSAGVEAPTALVAATAPPITTLARASHGRVFASSRVELPYEGLPRLQLAALETPDPLATTLSDDAGLQIPRLEVAPIYIPRLSVEQELK